VGEVKSGGAKVVLEAITRRESSLALFHLMGKVLYNKREFWGRSLFLFLFLFLFTPVGFLYVNRR